MKRGFFFAVCLMCMFVAGAQAQQSLKGLPRMNGYSLTQFGNFIKDWKLVTVRFRHDSNELRFVYANDVAWKVLNDGGKVYPDGAVFAKIAIVTQEDPAFPSSAVPAGSRRYQLMVKDSKKHTETNGWGYALFGADGLTTDPDPVNQTMACHACHAIVPDKDYVFSEPMQLGMPEDYRPASAGGDALGARLTYKTFEKGLLPERVRNLIPQQYNEVRVMQGGITNHIFAGTLDEIRPALIVEVNAAKMPALLVSQDGRMYSLVYPDPDKTACKTKSGADGVNYKAHYSLGHDMSGDRAIDYCQSK
ncbi:MAG: cytochrome P460 family protein [Alphaproteobacteria bacterium]|nr:cytochrome P460 family protein [Alphaproteobacteria bacterium]